jgi:U3 small nucleolar RNA-associated protein 23
VITQCSISELYANADPTPITLAKSCERRRCGHIPDPLSSHDCLTSCINISGENKHRYILATQDEQLRVQMRRIPGVPMLYIRRAVMIMEPPSPASLARRDALEREKLSGLEGQGKRKWDDEEGEETVRKKKRRPKEPNPLSVKKKKNTTPAKAIIQPVENSEQNVADKEGSVDNVEREQNVIGDVTDSIRRHKSTRRRKHHKKSKPNSETIEAEG